MGLLTERPNQKATWVKVGVAASNAALDMGVIDHARG